MLFEGRELKPYAEPVKARDISEGETYFLVSFLDDALHIPEVKPVVYAGKNLSGETDDICYFQDADSYRAGVRHDSERDHVFGEFHTFPADALNNIFVFDKALEELMHCSLRRKNTST